VNTSSEHDYGSEFFCNNTFYNCNNFFYWENLNPPDAPEFVKYNVGYGIKNNYFLWNYNSIPMSSLATIDSNTWFDPALAFNGRYGGASHNWIQWRSAGFDTHGFNANPNFANPAGGDFSRPSVTEMNRTYGGRTWTKFGAIQGIPVPDVTPPVIYGRSITNITTTGATIVWLTDEPAHTAVDIGTSTSYGRTDSSLVLSTVHSITISGLSPTTGYHFRVRSRDGSGNATTSSDSTFTTLTPDVTPPVISNRTVTGIGINTATIGWTTDEPSHSAVDVGTSLSYGRTDSSLNLVTNHSIIINALTPNTTYHFRVRSRDASNNARTSGDSTFLTLPSSDTTRPVITNVAANNITDHAAVITWNTNEAASTRLEYGFTTAYGTTTPLDSTLLTSHTVNLTSLTADTLYHYRVRSRDASGNEGISGDFNFRTQIASLLENVSIGLRDSVSDTYDGYFPDRVNDGVINPRGGTNTTWASNETTSPHWIVLYFDTLRAVSSAKVYWAWNAGRSTWACSQQFNIQYWNQGTGAYVNAASVTNTTADSVTTVQFSTVSTTRIRYYQPANMGPTDYPSVVWLTEFSLSGPSIPPEAIDDLGMLPWGGSQEQFWGMQLNGLPSFHERRNYLGD
jgi:hypothetical protein